MQLDRPGLLRSALRYWAVASVALSTCGGCTRAEDVVGVVIDDFGADAASTGTLTDAGVPEAYQLVGRTLQNWPFTIVPWPLAEPLAEFFGQASAGNGSRTVEIDGAEAAAFGETWLQMQRGELGPSNSVLGVRDETGDEYLITLKAR